MWMYVCFFQHLRQSFASTVSQICYSKPCLFVVITPIHNRPKNILRILVYFFLKSHLAVSVAFKVCVQSTMSPPYISKPNLLFIAKSSPISPIRCHWSLPAFFSFSFSPSFYSLMLMTYTLMSIFWHVTLC